MTIERRHLNLLKDALKSIPKNKAQEDILDLDNFISILLIEKFIEFKGKGGLTEHQRMILTKVILEGYSEKDLSESLKISQQAISYALTAALNKIYRYLLNPEIKPPEPIFTPETSAKLMFMYSEGFSSKEIASELNIKLRTVRNKIRYLRERGVLDVLPRELRKDKQEQRSPGDGS